MLFAVKIEEWDNDKRIALRFISENCITLKIHSIFLYNDDYECPHGLAYRPIELNNSSKQIDIIPVEKNSYNKVTFICTDDNGNNHNIRLSLNDYSKNKNHIYEYTI